MRTYKSDNLLYSTDEFFVAVLTDIGTSIETPCGSNTPCSWAAYPFCASQTAVDLSQDPILTGDWQTDYNVAYPLNANDIPPINSLILMRFRGTNSDGQNIYEFVTYKSSTEAGLALTAIQCSGDILTKTYSTGCRNQAA